MSFNDKELDSLWQYPPESLPPLFDLDTEYDSITNSVSSFTDDGSITAGREDEKEMNVCHETRANTTNDEAEFRINQTPASVQRRKRQRTIEKDSLLRNKIPKWQMDPDDPTISERERQSRLKARRCREQRQKKLEIIKKLKEENRKLNKTISVQLLTSNASYVLQLCRSCFFANHTTA